jgi:hypothetical protein
MLKAPANDEKEALKFQLGGGDFSSNLHLGAGKRNPLSAFFVATAFDNRNGKIEKGFPKKTGIQRGFSTERYKVVATGSDGNGGVGFFPERLRAFGGSVQTEEKIVGAGGEVAGLCVSATQVAVERDAR